MEERGEKRRGFGESQRLSFREMPEKKKEGKNPPGEREREKEARLCFRYDSLVTPGGKKKKKKRGGGKGGGGPSST